MKNLFISWSGARSQTVAEALYEWLPTVIQSIDPWLSIADIEKGTRWSTEIASQLQQLRFGIICLTADNLNAPWLLFEAGALSKTIDKTFVCPYLLDIHPTDLQGPFVQFQATKAEKEDTKKLLHTINKALGEMGIQDNMLEKQFEKWWPELEKKLATIPKLDDRKLPKREDRDLLEEILQLVRNLTRNSQFEPRTSTPSADLELLSLRSQGVSKEIHEIEERIKQLLGEQDIGKAQGASQELAKLTENKEKASRRLAQLQAQIAMLQQTLVTRK